MTNQDSKSNKKNALIGEAVALILSTKSLQSSNWDALSVVINFADGRKSENGFIYQGDTFEGWSTGGADVILKMRELRQQMIADGDRPWHQALVQITKPDLNLTIQFEYDNPTRWSNVTRSLDMSDYAKSLRV